MHIYLWRIDPPTPQSIEHRCLDYCYTKLGRSGRYSTMHTYTKGRLTLQSIKHRCFEYHYTKLGRSGRYSTMHIYTKGRLTSQSIKHRCLEYHYTKASRSSRYSTMHTYAWQIDPTSLLQLSIDLWKTITPNMFYK